MLRLVSFLKGCVAGATLPIHRATGHFFDQLEGRVGIAEDTVKAA
jgi:hypothetical protein